MKLYPGVERTTVFSDFAVFQFHVLKIFVFLRFSISRRPCEKLFSFSRKTLKNIFRKKCKNEKLFLWKTLLRKYIFHEKRRKTYFNFHTFRHFPIMIKVTKMAVSHFFNSFSRTVNNSQYPSAASNQSLFSSMSLNWLGVGVSSPSNKFSISESYSGAENSGSELASDSS